MQKLFSSHSVPSPLSDSKAKLVHYISSLSPAPLFLTQSLFRLPHLLRLHSIAFLKFRIWVCFAPRQSVTVSSVYKCQSPFYQANLLNRKPLIRVRPAGPSMVLEARRVRRRQLWVVLSALMDHTGAYRPPCQLPKIAHHPQPKIQSPLTDHQTPVQK